MSMIAISIPLRNKTKEEETLRVKIEAGKYENVLHYL
jgi:hypothetical protein